MLRDPGTQNAQAICVYWFLPSEDIEHCQSLVKYNQWGYSGISGEIQQSYFQETGSLSLV